MARCTQTTTATAGTAHACPAPAPAPAPARVLAVALAVVLGVVLGLPLAVDSAALPPPPTELVCGAPRPGVDFVDAWAAAWEVARTQGYAGPPLGGTGQQIGTTGVYVYAYLNGDVTLLRGFAGHGMNPTQEQYLIEFLRDCEPIECDGDLTGDGTVNVDDLLEVISNWSSPWGIDDLLLVIAGWGSCE